MIDATPLLRGYARHRLAQLARLDPVRAQTAELRRLLRVAAGTRFGRAHGFSGIGSVREYQRRVPLRRYEAFWEEFWRPAFPTLRGITWPTRLPFLALSSGTSSGATKYLPVSPQMARANSRAALDVLAQHAGHFPNTRLLAGRNLMLGGSTALDRLGGGVRAGDLSGIVAWQVPWWARRRFFPPLDIALIPDWDRKIAAMAPRSLQADIHSLSGTASWLLLFFEQLAALHPDRPRRLAAFYPHLELIVHGGVSFTPYREAFAEWLHGSAIRTQEVYAASEGFIAIQDRGPGEGMRLLLDNGIFYEFVEPDALDDPAAGRHWIADARIGRNYALVLSTNAGLWSYVLGDTVELVDRSPPRVLITGRTSYWLSVAGEHLIGRELDMAITTAAAELGTQVADYTAAALPPGDDGRPGHLFVVEFSGAVPESVTFGQALDRALAAMNADYRAHRPGLSPPRIVLVPPGAFADWMRRRGRLGGQNKVPRVVELSALSGDEKGRPGLCPGAGWWQQPADPTI